MAIKSEWINGKCEFSIFKMWCCFYEVGCLYLIFKILDSSLSTNYDIRLSDYQFILSDMYERHFHSLCKQKKRKVLFFLLARVFVMKNLAVLAFAHILGSAREQDELRAWTWIPLLGHPFAVRHADSMEKMLSCTLSRIILAQAVVQRRTLRWRKVIQNLPRKISCLSHTAVHIPPQGYGRRWHVPT